MRNIDSIDGMKIKRAILASGFTKEQVVASVQESGIRFSLAGLDKMFVNTFPVKHLEEILEQIALKCGCLASDFGESKVRQKAKKSA